MSLYNNNNNNNLSYHYVSVCFALPFLLPAIENHASAAVVIDTGFQIII